MFTRPPSDQTAQSRFPNLPHGKASLGSRLRDHLPGAGVGSHSEEIAHRGNLIEFPTAKLRLGALRSTRTGFSTRRIKGAAPEEANAPIAERERNTRFNLKLETQEFLEEHFLNPKALKDSEDGENWRIKDEQLAADLRFALNDEQTECVRPGRNILSKELAREVIAVLSGIHPKSRDLEVAIAEFLRPTNKFPLRRGINPEINLNSGSEAARRSRRKLLYDSPKKYFIRLAYKRLGKLRALSKSGQLAADIGLRVPKDLKGNIAKVLGPQDLIPRLPHRYFFRRPIATGPRLIFFEPKSAQNAGGEATLAAPLKPNAIKTNFIVPGNRADLNNFMPAVRDKVQTKGERVVLFMPSSRYQDMRTGELLESDPINDTSAMLETLYYDEGITEIHPIYYSIGTLIGPTATVDARVPRGTFTRGTWAMPIHGAFTQHFDEINSPEAGSQFAQILKSDRWKRFKAQLIARYGREIYEHIFDSLALNPELIQTLHELGMKGFHVIGASEDGVLCPRYAEACAKEMEEALLDKPDAKVSYTVLNQGHRMQTIPDPGEVLTMDPEGKPAISPYNLGIMEILLSAWMLPRFLFGGPRTPEKLVNPPPPLAREAQQSDSGID